MAHTFVRLTCSATAGSVRPCAARQADGSHDPPARSPSLYKAVSAESLACRNTAGFDVGRGNLLASLPQARYHRRLMNPDVTRLLKALEQGDPHAAEEL